MATVVAVAVGEVRPAAGSEAQEPADVEQEADHDAKLADRFWDWLVGLNHWPSPSHLTEFKMWYMMCYTTSR